MREGRGEWRGGGLAALSKTSPPLSALRTSDGTDLRRHGLSSNSPTLKTLASPLASITEDLTSTERLSPVNRYYEQKLLLRCIDGGIEEDGACGLASGRLLRCSVLMSLLCDRYGLAVTTSAARRIDFLHAEGRGGAGLKFRRTLTSDRRTDFQEMLERELRPLRTVC